MNRYFFTLVVSASVALVGCSSSGSSSTSGPGNPTLPIEDDSPQWGLDMGDTPDWGLVDPDFGVPDTGETPDRLPPVWGGPELPPIDNGPEAGYTISGNTVTDANGNVYNITSVDWHEQSMKLVDEEGNEYHVSIIHQGEYEGDFGIVIDGESIIIGGDAVSGGLRPMMEGTTPSLDRNSIRETIRARLN